MVKKLFTLTEKVYFFEICIVNGRILEADNKYSAQWLIIGGLSSICPILGVFFTHMCDNVS